MVVEHFLTLIMFFQLRWWLNWNLVGFLSRLKEVSSRSIVYKVSLMKLSSKFHQFKVTSVCTSVTNCEWGLPWVNYVCRNLGRLTASASTFLLHFMISVTWSQSYRLVHGFQLCFALTLLLTDMFSFLQQSIELQKQVLQFISGGRVKTAWHTLIRDQFRPDINFWTLSTCIRIKTF